MKVKTKINAGALTQNHNESRKGVKVASQVKAGRRPGRPR